MKVAPCVQEVSGHTTSLLTSLNLQREKALFCDCVVRQKESPGQLYPAHRCVLAASSPVLASVLSSTGALVELRDPCLSGSVLAFLLDYIYTGALPCACSHEQYNRLLTAACYLQMNKLQETLCAWQQTEINKPDETDTATGTESQAHKNISTHSEAADTFSECLLSTSSTDASRRVKGAHTCSVQSTASLLQGTNLRQYDDTWVHSNGIDAYIKNAKTDTHSACSITGAGVLSDSSRNVGDCSEVIHPTPQVVIQNIPSTSEGYSVSTVDKDMQTDHFQSAGTIKPETWQRSPEEEPVKTLEVSSSSLQYPCSVPVICHSSRAAGLQLAEVSTSPHYYPAIRAPGEFSGVSTSQSASSENESFVKDVNTELKNHYETENLDYRHKKDNCGTHSLDGLDRCDTQDSCYKSITTQSVALKQDYTCSSTDHLIKVTDKHVGSGLSHINERHGNSMYDQDMNQAKQFEDDSVQQKNSCSSFIRGLKYKTKLSFDDFPSKHKRLDWSDRDVSIAAAEEGPRDPTVGPVQDLETRSDSRCEDLCSEVEVKEEHSCSSKYSSEIRKHSHHCNLHGPQSDWNQRLHEVDTSTKGAISSQHGSDTVNRNPATEDGCSRVSNTPESNLDVTDSPSAFELCPLQDLRKISDTDALEPYFTFTVPLCSSMSDSMHSAVGQSYHGHVHYHCLSQEETHLSHLDSDRKHSHPRYPDCSDQSSDDEAFGTSASPGQSPMAQHFDTGTPEQVLLLDISTKHSELLVSYKHRADQERKALDPIETGTENDDREQINEATSVVRARIRDRTKFRAKTFSESGNNTWVRETNVGHKQFVDSEKRRLGPEVKNKARAVEVSKHEEGANQTSTLTGCSAPTVPESAQASMSSTSSVCIPSSLPASTSTNIPAHLSTPGHQAFQCSLCDRSFSQRGSLNRHVRSHLGVRPFPCPCCPMTFSRQYRVTEHMRVHQRCTLGNDLLRPMQL